MAAGACRKIVVVAKDASSAMVGEHGRLVVMMGEHGFLVAPLGECRYSMAVAIASHCGGRRLRARIAI